MKKSNAIMLILAIICTLSFIGCGEDSENSTKATNSAKPTSSAQSTIAPTNTVSPVTTEPTSEPELIRSNIQVGEYIEFGEYEQDGDLNTKNEKIEWLVLAVEKNKALIISKYCLDCVQYHKNNDCWQVDWKSGDIIIYKEPVHATHEKVTYETSSLRKWLTKDFYNKAFSNVEKKKILKTRLTTNQGNINDTVFLLNKNEVNTYFSSADDRLCEATQYAKDNGAYIYENGKCCWWLRNQDERQDTADYIRGADGVVSGGTFACVIDNTVRPALWVALGTNSNETIENTAFSTTQPTQVPTKEPTTAPTQAPTATPTAVAKPTADPAIYPDDWGMDAYNLPIKTDGEKFFWKNSRVIYDIPKNAPLVEDWYGIFSDEKNDQLIFYTGDMSEGTYTYYAIVEGEFYKLSEGKIVSRSMHSGKNQLWWIEDNGIAKSVNARSNKYNEVYTEAEGVKGYNTIRPYTYIKFNDDVISPITENVLLNIKKIN